MLKSILASMLAASMAVPAAGALAASPPDCVLQHIVAVREARATAGGYTVLDRLAGATLYIPAESGLTTDWLKRLADTHHLQMAGGMTMRDCVFGVPGSEIEVSSNNSGFLMVTIRSKDAAAAKEILRRAELAVK